MKATAEEAAAKEAAAVNAAKGAAAEEAAAEEAAAEKATAEEAAGVRLYQKQHTQANAVKLRTMRIGVSHNQYDSVDTQNDNAADYRVEGGRAVAGG